MDNPVTKLFEALEVSNHLISRELFDRDYTTLDL